MKRVVFVAEEIAPYLNFLKYIVMVNILIQEDFIQKCFKKDDSIELTKKQELFVQVVFELDNSMELASKTKLFVQENSVVIIVLKHQLGLELVKMVIIHLF